MGLPKRTKGKDDPYGKRAVNRHSVQAKNSARSQEKVIETRVRREGKAESKVDHCPRCFVAPCVGCCPECGGP